MVRPNIAKWEQSVEDLRRHSIEAKHQRTRERFLALYMIASAKKNASQWAREIGRRKQTVLEWIHTYNKKGPESLVYQRTGGRKKKLSEAEKKR